MERPVVAPVRRVALELAPDDLQAEVCTNIYLLGGPKTNILLLLVQFASYGITTGDANARLASLQDKYDDEYDTAVVEYEAALHKLEMQRTKQAYQDALSTAVALERTALEREPKSATIVHEIETNVAPKETRSAWDFPFSLLRPAPSDAQQHERGLVGSLEQCAHGYRRYCDRQHAHSEQEAAGAGSRLQSSHQRLAAAYWRSTKDQHSADVADAELEPGFPTTEGAADWQRKQQ